MNAEAVMHTPADFLNFAKESLRFADLATIEEERQAFLDMARKWTEAALSLEGIITSKNNDSDSTPKDVLHC
jgi:hypothetical protein